VSSNAAREVADRLRLIRDLAASEAPQAACTALGRAAETAVKVKLTSSTHPVGTPTPSRPGQPPSLVTGALRRSMLRTPAKLASEGVSFCSVGSKLIYAPVHEFGPVTITARRFPQLGNPTVGFFGRSVTIPRRPYLAPTVLGLETTGIAERVCCDAWRSVIDL